MSTEVEIYTEGTALGQAYLDRVIKAIGDISLWQVCKAAKYLHNAYVTGGTVWCVGNGGSHANAAHLSLHLQERGYRAIDMLGEGAVASALANDYTYEGSLARRLQLLAKPGDVLVIISGSGNSINVLTALAEAKRLEMPTIGLLGFGGGMSRELVRVPITLQAKDYGPVEDAHSAIIHMLAEMLGSTGHGPALAR